jgi:hypothetical protein
VPLHTQAERGSGFLDGFDDPIGRGRRHHEASRHALDRLMVTAVDRHICVTGTFYQCRQTGCGGESDAVYVRRFCYRRPSAPVEYGRLELSRDVLHQRAAG